MFDSILVVCIGNICRSPIGERLLKKAFPNKKISSAGLGALVGHAADPNSISVSKVHNISLEGHQAKQLTAQMCRDYDLILVMERKHLEGVCRLAPEVRGKTLLFAHWLEQKEIPDPYKKSYEAFEYVFDSLNKSVDKWIPVLSSGK
ncbi:protein tyrosine phosphatase [Serratia sp. J2]|uniref:arsenate reductase/protein-tyrosine-phosphatase family protein n=1 Tax=Serratia sp. J2 TaxID=3386551 RepID=UPI003916FE31